MNAIFTALILLLFLGPGMSQAATYANAATTFNWIDASTHTQVTSSSAPYKFSNLGGCGTSPPVIDDTISDKIPIGFNFTFGNKAFDSVRIMTNGRIQLTSNTIPLDNATCGYGSPVTQLAFPNASLNNTMRIYGNDLDPTPKSGTYSSPCQDGVTAANNPCYISFASIGSSPTRRFVATWKGVPEWTATSTASGAYNVQLILNEDGTFIYQYGTDVPGPAANTAQVGWQLSTTDYDAPSVGYPVPNTAIKYFVPHPLVEYLMEQTSWSGATPVLDTSGSGQNGALVGATPPALTAAGKVCKGAFFTGATGQAINAGLSVPTGIGNTGTIAFWYKSSSALNWNNAANVDEVLLDATTTSGQWFYLVKRGGTGDAGKLRFVMTDSSGVARVVQTTALSVASGTWKHIAVTWSFNNYVGGNNDRLRIYVDAAAPTPFAFTSTTLTTSPSIGTLYVGGTRSGLADTGLGTGSTKGTIDEFRTYNYEATQASISAMMNLNAGGCLHHYSISNANTGLTCQATPVTLAAHTLSHGTYTSYNSVTLSASDNQGSWVLLTGLGVLTNIGSNTGQATYLFNGESSAQLSYVHATGVAGLNFSATDGAASQQERFALTITSCVPGRFNACEYSATRCTPTVGSYSYANLNTKLANTAFLIDPVAVDVSGVLDPTFSGAAGPPAVVKTVNINLLANTTAPTINATTNCPSSPPAETISLGAVAFTSGRGPTGGVNVPATAFSAASQRLSAYRDVRVQFVCTAANCGSARTDCATDAFSVRPLAFTISSSASADSAGLSATATPVFNSETSYHAGGATFSLTANTGTKGYNGLPSIDATKLFWAAAPAGGRGGLGAGTVNGAFTSTASLASGNGASGSNFTYDEVGYFALQPGGVYDNSFTASSGDQANGDCVSGSYSNTAAAGKFGCLIANTANTNYFGRFIPDHFAVVTPVSFAAGCAGGGFSYMDQGFSLAASVEARNGGDIKTQNYSGASFGKGVVAVQLENNNSGTAIPISRLQFVGTPSWTGGGYSISATAFSKLTGGALDGPYDALDVGVRVTDSDGAKLTDRNMDASNTICTNDSAGTSDGTCVATKLISTKMRYGRLRLVNAFGAEHLALAVPTLTEYWNGLRWLKNMDDSCTSFNIPTTGNSGLILALTSGTSSASMADGTVSGSCATGTCTFYKGDGRLILSAPGAHNTGYVDITLTPPGWLLYSGMNQNTTARASFGFYNQSGNAKKIIYRREVR